jgi:hypothetical protein
MKPALAAFLEDADLSPQSMLELFEECKARMSVSEGS